MRYYGTDIGMDPVVEVIVDLYDEGAFDVQTARKLVLAYREDKAWCNGIGKVLSYTEDHRCGYCLRPKEEVGELRSLYDFLMKKYGVTAVFQDTCFRIYEKVMSDNLCEQCMNLLIAEDERDLKQRFDQGLKQGFEQGLGQGIAKAEERNNKLVEALLAADRVDDLRRSVKDVSFRQRLYKEFGIS